MQVNDITAYMAHVGVAARTASREMAAASTAAKNAALRGLAGVPLAVVVMMAALPLGTNALIFAQRYDTLQAEATTAIVFTTLAFAATASLWLGVLAWLGGSAGG